MVGHPPSNTGGGDFNCWLDPILDRSSSRPGVVSRSASYIQSFISEFGISDIWRFLNPGARQYSFFSSAHRTYTRIDYIFVDNRLIPQVRSCTYQGIVISDHAPVVMSLILPDAPRPTRHWRLNPTLLSDPQFVKYVEEQIVFFFETNCTPDVSILVIWDTFKAYLRGQITAFTANKKRQSQKEQLELISKIQEIDQQYALDQAPELYNQRLELKTKFDLLTTYHIENLLLKSKSTYYEHSEKTGKLLANQLKGIRAKQLITNIHTDSGDITRDLTKINNTFKIFYSKLYTSQFHGDNAAIKAFLEPLPTPTIPAELVEKMEAPLCQAEIAMAISSM